MSAQDVVLPSLVSTSSMAIIVLFTVLATGAIGLRVWARKIAGTHGILEADDYVIIVALFFSWGLFITAIVAAAGGGINTLQGNPLDDGILFLKIFFVEPLLEFPGQALTRISVLLFYKRLFVTKSFQMICNVMIGVISSWAFSAVITDLTGIRPIWMAWDPMGQWDIDFGAYGIAIASIGIAIDLITVTLPLPVIHQLHMRTRNKVFTAGILWLGLFCTVADSVRLYYTVVELRIAVTDIGPDRYLVGRQVWLWDRIAPCASIIAACLPTYGPILRTRGLESVIRSATSWLSFRSSQGSPGQSSNHNEGVREEGNRGSGSQKADRSWEQLPHKKNSASTHGSTHSYPLHDLNPEAHREERQDNPGVTVTSTVNLEYSHSKPDV